MRPRTLLATLAVTALLGGCASTTTADQGAGSAGSSASPSTSGDPEHDMAGMDMSDDGSAGPTGPAAMICSDEIAGAVERTFGLATPPQGHPTWRAADRTYTCHYAVPGGSLVLSVQDALEESQGRAHYTGLRSSLAGARDLKGMENFGFPAFGTSSGHVVFLKDGKTLDVDASGLDAARLPQRFSRQDTAYSVASAVIGCWTE